MWDSKSEKPEHDVKDISATQLEWRKIYIMEYQEEQTYVHKHISVKNTKRVKEKDRYIRTQETSSQTEEVVS